MKLLDLFCCAGGAAMGYYRAGFTEIIGVDIRMQKNYPFDFVQADALNPPFDLRDFDLIHASPPCQAFTSMKTMHNAKPHADLLTPTRAMLLRSGQPFVIENVVGAPLCRGSVLLCGSLFGLGIPEAELRRHRIFESSMTLGLVPQCQHGSSVIGVYGGHGRNRKRVPTIGVYGGGHGVGLHRREKGEKSFTASQQREAMGIDWMTVDELSQAIPPAYTHWIGRRIMEGM